MMRITLSKQLFCRSATMNAAKMVRSLSTTATARVDETGGMPPSGGGGDAFSKRGHALEEMAMRKREHEKLLALKQKITEQQQHLKQLSDHIDELTSDKDDQKK